jgi:hypothetical protein
VEHAVWQRPHLGVAALARVGAKDLWQAGYAAQGLKHGAKQWQSAGAAAGEAGPEKDQLVRFAERADGAVRRGVLA